MLRWRLSLGVLFVAAMIGICWIDYRATMPGMGLLPLALIIAIFATREVLDLSQAAGMRPVRQAVYIGNILIILSSFLAYLPVLYHLGEATQYMLDASKLQANSLADFLLTFGFATLMIIFCEMERYTGPGGHLANIGGGMFALVYVGLMLAFAVQMRLYYGIGAIAAWIIVVKMSDTGAYIVGRLFGRHKMAPRISPGKTLEGLVGALAFSCLGSWCAFRWLIPATTPDYVPAAPALGWLVFGIIVGAAGVFGDLAESLLKRDVGVKDSSTWMPGFGGILDMVDSLLLSAPIAWFCWALGVVGR